MLPSAGRFFAGRQQHARRLCARARPPSPFSGASPLKPALEPARRLLNAGLEQIGSPVRLSVDGGDAAAALGKDAPQVDPRPPLEPVVPLELIEAYVDDVLATDSVVNNALLPDTLERPAYVLVVQVVLHLLQECLGYLDGSRFFRRALTVQQSHSSVAALKHSGLALDAAMIEAIAARTSSSQAAPIISQRVDHALYVSCVRFALRLAADMLASGRLVSMLGLEVTWSVRMLPQVAHAPKGAPPTNAGWDDAFLEERFGSMVDRLLQKRDINLAMVPDHLERELYLNVVRLLLNIATTALSSHDGAGGTQVDIFGVSARFSLE